MAERCGRVDLWVFGHYMVKFDTEKEPVKKALLGCRRCPNDSAIEIPHDGCIFQWCLEHAADPTCGVTPQMVAAVMPSTETVQASP